VLPNALDQGGRGPHRFPGRRLRLSLLLRAGGTEVDAAIVSGHQKLVLAKLGTRMRPSGLGILRRRGAAAAECAKT